MSSKTREVRVTLEVLGADGATLATETVLVDAEGEELADGGLGDIESALDVLLADASVADEGEDA